MTIEETQVEIKTVNEAYEACAKLRQMGFVWDELNEEWVDATPIAPVVDDALWGDK